MKIMRILGLMFVLLYPASVLAANTPEIVAARPSGTAPLFVFFDGFTNTAWDGTDYDTVSERFHNLTYSWHFGDPAVTSASAFWGVGNCGNEWEECKNGSGWSRVGSYGNYVGVLSDGVSVTITNAGCYNGEYEIDAANTHGGSAWSFEFNKEWCGLENGRWKITPEYWEFSGQSKNLDYGPSAGHVFETPGIYTVTLTVTDGSNTATDTQVITVDDPDVTFANTTICVSYDADTTGCPDATYTTLSTTDFDQALSNALATGCLGGSGCRRILFKAGTVTEAFTSNTPVNVYYDGPGHIGSFGTANDGRAYIVSTHEGTVFRLGRSSLDESKYPDWRITDFDFDGPAISTSGAAGHDAIVDSLSNGAMEKVLLMRLSAKDYCLPFYLPNVYEDDIATVNERNQELALVEVSIPTNSNLGARILYVIAEDSAILGNEWDAFPTRHNDGLHLFRVQYADNLVIAHNEFWNAGVDGAALRNCSYAGAADYEPVCGDRPSQFYHIRTNIWHGCEDYDGSHGPCTVPVVVKPGHGNLVRSYTYDMLFEGNFFVSSVGDDTSKYISIENGERITVRNNIFDMTNVNTLTPYGVHIWDRLNYQDPTDVHVYNNTCYSDKDGGTVYCANFGVGTSNEMKNNLSYCSGTATCRTLLGTIGIGSGDDQPNVIATSLPFVSSSPTSIEDFMLGADSQGRDAGIYLNNVLLDIGGRTRGTPTDVGAWEGGSSGYSGASPAGATLQ